MPPIYFIYSSTDVWPELFAPASSAALDPDVIPERFISGPDCWIIQTYLRLRARGLDVHLSPHFVPRAICVAHSDDIHLRSPAYNSYIVAIRADRPPYFICEHTIVQNPVVHRYCKPPFHYIPHWPQPGLIPRDPARPPRVSQLAFFGAPYQLSGPSIPEDCREQLFARGIQLTLEHTRWFDYQNVDAVIAVRTGGGHRECVLETKPASKLYNAWFAGCPAFLGPEPAFQNLRQSDLDYFEVNAWSDVLEGLDKLNQNPALYNAMIQNGRQRATEFSINAIAGRWQALLTGRVTAGYERWLTAFAIRRPLRAATFAVRALRQRAAQKIWKALP